MHYTLCRLDEIPNPGAKGIYLEAARIDLFLVRRGEILRAYRNRCPHTGAPMEWMPDQFLNLDGDLIQCGMHAALFQIHDGRCIAGPCNGRSLQALPIVVRDGMVLLDEGGHEASD